uniref:Caspase-8 n=1 Tax=Chelonoidis abingdonii TaxID=106734 RepID=A0A8C0HB54_CHEAB
MSTDIYKLLFFISEELDSETLMALKFLSLEYIPLKNQEDIQDPKDFFQKLQNLRLIEEEDLSFLKELLFRVNRIDLLTGRLSSSRDEMERELQIPNKAKVSPYRYGTILKLFIEMEKAGIMNETKLKVLKSVLQDVRPDLAQKINTYEVETREALKRVFEWLQFETIEHRNLEAEEICKTIKKYSNMDHSNMDCFICCLLSHGEKGKVRGTDWNSAAIKDLVSCFTGSECRSLAGKPKLFFIQACQGKTGQKSIPVKEDSSGQLEADALPLPSIPDWADILISMATVEDFECYRYIERGSAFIQCLCKEIESFCPQCVDLLTILTHVNQKMGDKDFNGKKQMPEIKSTLRKQLIFQVPALDN